MIIWINGAFGSGKTQTAAELHRRLENSHVYDPERAGFFLRRNMPAEISGGNFQHKTVWRTINYELIKYMYAAYRGTLIIPMTLYDKTCFEEIIGKLRQDGVRVDHYILGADRETILKRLSKRLEKKNSWAAQHIEICLRGFDALKDRSICIDTNTSSIYDTVETIAETSVLRLKKDTGTKLARAIQRAAVQIKHIRLFT
ncbi:MAG: ATP-binding protein [Spirochaetaceae bacterium]|jgi:cytidylate kinase|nr:ATP-binding protein [Spirochaetaceae bacterium]